MAEQVQETVLSSLTDDLANSFFDGGASSSNVMLPEKDEDSPVELDLNKTSEKKTKENQSFKNPEIQFDTEELLGDFLDKGDDEPEYNKPEQKEETSEEKRSPGRPKKVDNELGFEVESLFEDELLLPFDDDQPVKSIKDLKDLIKANKEDAKIKGKEEALKDYKDTLPEPIKMILDYTENGGNDIDGFLKALGQARNITDLDIEKEFDRKEIVRQFYQLQGWTPEEVDEEIESLLDLGEDKLKNVATKLKPKLDRMQEETLQYQMEQTKQQKENQKKAQQFYVNSVVDSLKKGSLGDIKLTQSEQKDLYSALVEERYPTINGGHTNRLGAILDKIQYIEPNYELLAEVTMLLSDPVSYKNKIREQVKKEVTADTIKKVKSEQGIRKSGATIDTPPSGSQRLKKLEASFRNPFA